jgi:undecaprenyl-diphosphatase
VSRVVPPVSFPDARARNWAVDGHDVPRDSKATAPDEPYAAIPTVRTVAGRVAISTAVLIASLTIVGALITSASLALGVRRWDESVSSWLATDRSDEFVRIAKWFSKMADTRPILGIMALVTVVLAIGRRWRAMLFVPIAMLVEISTFLAVNYLVARPRPDVSKIGSIPSTYSFPSGHVAATLVCWIGPALLLQAFGLSKLARATAAIGAVVTVMTVWARVYLGMHHALDVVVGLVMGVAALAISVRSLNVRFKPSF